MFWNPKFWKVFVFWNFVFLVIKSPVSVVTGCLGFLVFYCFIILLLCLVLSSDNLGIFLNALHSLASPVSLTTCFCSPLVIFCFILVADCFLFLVLLPCPVF